MKNRISLVLALVLIASSFTCKAADPETVIKVRKGDVEGAIREFNRNLPRLEQLRANALRAQQAGRFEEAARLAEPKAELETKLEKLLERGSQDPNYYSDDRLTNLFLELKGYRPGEIRPYGRGYPVPRTYQLRNKLIHLLAIKQIGKSCGLLSLSHAAAIQQQINKRKPITSEETKRLAIQFFNDHITTTPFFEGLACPTGEVIEQFDDKLLEFARSILPFSRYNNLFIPVVAEVRTDITPRELRTAAMLVDIQRFGSPGAQKKKQEYINAIRSNAVTHFVIYYIGHFSLVSVVRYADGSIKMFHVNSTGGPLEPTEGRKENIQVFLEFIDDLVTEARTGKPAGRALPPMTTISAEPTKRNVTARQYAIIQEISEALIELAAAMATRPEAFPLKGILLNIPREVTPIIRPIRGGVVNLLESYQKRWPRMKESEADLKNAVDALIERAGVLLDSVAVEGAPAARPGPPRPAARPAAVQRRLREINIQLARLEKQQQEGAERGISATEQETITQKMLRLVAEREKLTAEPAAVVPPARRAPRPAPVVTPAMRERAADILLTLARKIQQRPAVFPDMPPRILNALPPRMIETIRGYQASWAAIKTDPRNINAIIEHITQEASKLTAEPAVVAPPARRLSPEQRRRRAANILFKLAGKIAKKPAAFPEMPPHIFNALPPGMRTIVEGYKRDWARIRTSPVRIGEISQNLVEKATGLSQ